MGSNPDAATFEFILPMIISHNLPNAIFFPWGQPMIELNKKHILPVSDAVAMTVVCLLHVSLGVSVSTAGLTGRLDLNLSKIYMATTNDQAVIYLFKATNGNTRTMCVCLKFKCVYV